VPLEQKPIRSGKHVVAHTVLPPDAGATQFAPSQSLVALQAEPAAPGLGGA